MLPLELVLAIAQHLPTAALPVLAQTCSTFAHAAQRVLYRHLTVSPRSRNLSVVALLARKHHIARHVRSFYVAVDNSAPVFACFYVRLAAALANLSELHALHLQIHSDASWVLPSLRSFPSLVRFSSSFVLDHNVVHFLSLTPALRELELDAVSTPTPLPHTAIPRLEQFIGSARVATTIVPGRPVSNIHLTPSILAEDDIPLLARSTAPILVLSAAIDSSPIPFLHLVHRHLPLVVYLRVMSTQNLCQAPTAEFYEQVANVLDSFAQLSAFELSGIHWGSPRKRDSLSRRVWQSLPLPCTNDDILNN